MGDKIIGWALVAFLILVMLPACATVQPVLPIEYARVGGIAGFNDHLKIDANGHGALTRRSGAFDFELTADELGRWQAILRDADIATMPENPSKPPAPDEFGYLLTDQGRTIKTSDTAMPDKLRPVIALLNNLIEAKGK